MTPLFFYGTAWKEDATESLTLQAITQGFRAIDTANQRKHYYEAGVGKAIHAAIRSGLVSRENLFIQTKYTFMHGQDQRLPYDPAASITDQVQQSYAKSLEHLQIDALDSLVLHGPTTSRGLAADDWEAWRAIESLCQSGMLAKIGVSNVNAQQLDLLCGDAKVRPTFVQNRCYAIMGWDADVRAVCRKYGIHYQGFSLLTANRAVLNDAAVKSLAAKYALTTPQLIFRFAIDVGMIPITGTTNAEHMQQDLRVLDVQLKPDDVKQIETIAI